MSDHPVLTAVGVAAVALGVLMVLEPGLAAAIAADYTAVVLIGVLALVQGVRIARTRRATELRGAETPDVETVESMPVPGEEFDDRVATLRAGPRRSTLRERNDLRDRLREAAIPAVADRDHVSREEARERIEAGTWTDDAFAASFLGDSDAPKPPLSARLRLVASPRSGHQVRIRRTADAVARAAGVGAPAARAPGGTSAESGEDTPTRREAEP
ncbi:hypothetical protein NGM10_05565 [Halorussus salilacus]|uniref:DUF7269 family protein n=1 Tax=Halorussus salilacus TaxID=2953750 RepID=UPI0020A17DB7|nr:hypothetical protein [Halorussus salilacus]USZ69207.1 hypothetical protein NGM10_05565 [Halorussus salilacus]